MAEELWNRVNIPFPGAVSSVRVQFTSKTGALVENVLSGNTTVLQLIDSKILQTEIRVLYEILYILNNSYRGNKSFKGLQQVEQCVNRLKSMKLVEALLELAELCPNNIQRKVGLKTGECDVPSQPTLEWLCLKVLGAAHLMNCTLHRCGRAFLLCNQQMKWEEFIVLNMILTSMLSRLWVIFRGVLVSLSTLYENILSLCREVASTKPMPFLTTSSLPPSMSELLDPAFLNDLTEARIQKQKRERLMEESLSNTRGKRQQQFEEDLGISVKRDNADLKPFLNVFKTFTKNSHLDQETKNSVEAKKRWLKGTVKAATSFSDIYLNIDTFVKWCKWKNVGKERNRFLSLLLKCRKMRGLETEGFNVEKKLKNFRSEVFKACSNSLLPGRTNRPKLAASRGKVLRRTDSYSLRSHFKSNNVKSRSKKKWQVKGKKSRKSKSQRRHKDKGRRTEDEAIPQSSHCDSRDDIDDIFASIGL